MRLLRLTLTEHLACMYLSMYLSIRMRNLFHPIYTVSMYLYYLHICIHLYRCMGVILGNVD